MPIINCSDISDMASSKLSIDATKKCLERVSLKSIMQLTNWRERLSNEVHKEAFLIDLLEFAQSKYDVQNWRLFKRLLNFL